MTAIGEFARPDRYPRASRYDRAWLLDLDMGPNPLWLLEDLAGFLRPGGQLGMATPGMTREVRELGAIPEFTADGGEFLSFAMVTARKN